ncbi:MAG: non-canonical purine NTP pyrophosphatase, partial [Gammaproteobacteria bacterium]|nr:non-canonical purine NTP pyrophosphatase [Gammaproteobacteria bacterium]
YDPLFIDPESGVTSAELTPAEKNARSHRGRALAEFRRLFNAGRGQPDQPDQPD